MAVARVSIWTKEEDAVLTLVVHGLIEAGQEALAGVEQRDPLLGIYCRNVRCEFCRG